MVNPPPPVLGLSMGRQGERSRQSELTCDKKCCVEALTSASRRATGQGAGDDREAE